MLLAVAGSARFRRLNLPVLFELATNFELRDFLAILFLSDGKQITHTLHIVFGLGTRDHFRDLSSRSSCSQQIFVETCAVEVFRLVIQIGDLIQGAEIVLWVAVAIQAPPHGEGLIMANHFHFIDFAMATRAGHAAVDVNRMIEVGVVRKLVQLHPRHGLAGLLRLDDFLKLRASGLDVTFACAVTIDAGLIGGNVGMPRDFNETVTITTVESKLTRMNFVRKGDWLRWLVADASVLRRKVVGDPHRYARSDESERDG